MKEVDPETVNTLIRAWQSGDRGAYDGLFSLLHEELRQIARRLFARERLGHTLQTDDLVSKLYLKLLGANQVPWESYAHFLNAVSRTMRQILIDHARTWQRRGDGQGRIRLEDWELEDAYAITGSGSLHRLVALNQAIERLQVLDPNMALVADWKLSLGLTLNEIAQKQGVSLTSVKREWLIAKKILGNAVQ